MINIYEIEIEKIQEITKINEKKYMENKYLKMRDLVSEKIAEAAARGDWETVIVFDYCPSSIEKRIKKELKEKGYKISRTHFDEYGIDYWFEVNWKSRRL